MARKLIPQDVKWKAALRVLQDDRSIADEARRIGVTPKAVQKWIAEYLKEYPDADQRGKKPPPPPPKPPPDPVEKPQPSPSAGATDDKPGLIDAAAVKRAMEADGGAQPAPAPGAPPPPALAPLSLSTEADDMNLVEGIGNQVMGLAVRGLLFFFEWRAGVSVEWSEKLEKLCILTPTERAALKPASRPLAAKLREWIGSDENVAYAVGGSTVSQGLMDRYRTMKEAVGAAIAEAIAREKAEAPAP